MPSAQLSEVFLNRVLINRWRISGCRVWVVPGLCQRRNWLTMCFLLLPIMRMTFSSFNSLCLREIGATEKLAML